MRYGIDVTGPAYVDDGQVTFEGTEWHQHQGLSDIESITMGKFRQGDFEAIVTVGDGFFCHCKIGCLATFAEGN
jgi:hypothetical protein